VQPEQVEDGDEQPAAAPVRPAEQAPPARSVAAPEPERRAPRTRRPKKK